MATEARRPKRSYSEEFRQQMVQLHLAGKPRSEIIREYELTPSTLDKWVSRTRATGSTRAADQRTEEEKELIRLRKELKRLEMENDILKQAALIFAQRSREKRTMPTGTRYQRYVES